MTPLSFKADPAYALAFAELLGINRAAQLPEKFIVDVLVRIVGKIVEIKVRDKVLTRRSDIGSHSGILEILILKGLPAVSIVETRGQEQGGTLVEHEHLLG